MTFHHERRLDRALYHLANLKAEVRAWSQERPYRTWSDFDVDDRYKLTWLEVLDQPPADFGLIIGDCIHNLRAALDNLALELAIAHMGARLTKKIANDSGFPIFTQKNADTPTELHKRLRGVHPRAKAIIEGLQPYKRKDEFRRDPLWQLHWLDIQDKHQLPHVVLFAPQGLAFFVPDNLTADDIEPIARAVKNRAPIARYPAFDKSGAEVDVQPTPTFSVGFSERVPKELRAMQVPTRLALIHDYIASDVLRPLHPYLTRRRIVRASQRYSLLPSKI